VVRGGRGRGTVDESALEAELLDDALELVGGGLCVLRRDSGEAEEPARVLLAISLVLWNFTDHPDWWRGVVPSSCSPPWRSLAKGSMSGTAGGSLAGARADFSSSLVLKPWHPGSLRLRS
jgi:hypothetical protein